MSTLPPVTIHPPTPGQPDKPHHVRGKRFARLADAEARAAYLARRAGCYRVVFEHPEDAPPRLLAEVYPRTLARTEAGRDRARREGGA